MLKKLINTVLPIVFAVLLALALDAWYDNRKAHIVIQNSLSDIALDIRTYSGMGGVQALNSAYLDTLSMQIEQYEKGEQVTFTYGFGRPEINSLAWEMAKETGVASNFGRELYKDMAKVFKEFDRLERLWNYNYQFKLERDPDMNSYTLTRHFHRQMKTIQSRNQELIDKSNEFLQKYKDASFMESS